MKPSGFGGQRWQSLKINALSTLVARLIVPALNVLLVVAIARLAGAASLGQYTLLVTLFVLCENVKSLGLPSFAVREMAANGAEALDYYSALVRLGLCGALITALCFALGLGRLNHQSPEFPIACAVLSLGLFPSAYMFAGDALFLGSARAAYILWIALAENAVRLAASLAAVLLLHRGLIVLAAIYMATRCGAALGQTYLVKRIAGVAIPKPRTNLVLLMLRRSPSFFVIFIAPLIVLRLDIVMLRWLSGDAALGIYSAAMRLMTVCLIVPDAIMSASFAFLSKLAVAEDRKPFEELLNSTIVRLSAALVPVSLALALLASFATALLFGTNFAAAALPARTLAWALPPFAVNRALGDALVARGFQRTVAAIIVANVAISACLYWIAISLFDVNGAAWGFYLSILSFCLMSAWSAVRRGVCFPKPIAVAVIPPFACSAVFAMSHSLALWLIGGVLTLAFTCWPAVQSFLPLLGSRKGIRTPVAVEA